MDWPVAFEVTRHRSNAARNHALQSAAKLGQEDQVRKLLEAALVDVNSASSDGTTALIWACLRNHSPCVDLLLRHGASAELADAEGLTPLYVSCYKGHRCCAEILLEHNALVDHPNALGCTPMMAACMDGHADVVKLLSLSGASRDAVNNDGETAADLAHSYGNVHLGDWLDRTRCWSTPLHHLEGTPGELTPAEVHRLLGRGADPHAGDPSPLDVAVKLERAGRAPSTSAAAALLSWWRGRRERTLALAMGLHPRLGAESIVAKLDKVRDDRGRPTLLEMIALGL